MLGKACQFQPYGAAEACIPVYPWVSDLALKTGEVSYRDAACTTPFVLVDPGTVMPLRGRLPSNSARLFDFTRTNIVLQDSTLVYFKAGNSCGGTRLADLLVATPMSPTLGSVKAAAVYDARDVPTSVFVAGIADP